MYNPLFFLAHKSYFRYSNFILFWVAFYNVSVSCNLSDKHFVSDNDPKSRAQNIQYPSLSTESQESTELGPLVQKSLDNLDYVSMMSLIDRLTDLEINQKYSLLFEGNQLQVGLLSYCAYNSWFEVIQKILVHPGFDQASINDRDSNGFYPLLWSVYNRGPKGHSNAIAAANEHVDEMINTVQLLFDQPGILLTFDKLTIIVSPVNIANELICSLSQPEILLLPWATRTRLPYPVSAPTEIILHPLSYSVSERLKLLYGPGGANDIATKIPKDIPKKILADGYLEVVKILLGDPLIHPNISDITIQSNSLLHAAINCIDKHLVALLCSSPHIKLNVPNADGLTPLAHAKNLIQTINRCCSDDGKPDRKKIIGRTKSKLERIISLVGCTNNPEAEKKPSIMQCIVEHNKDKLKQILESCPDSELNQVNSDGDSPIVCAIRRMIQCYQDRKTTSPKMLRYSYSQGGTKEVPLWITSDEETSAVFEILLKEKDKIDFDTKKSGDFDLLYFLSFLEKKPRYQYYMEIIKPLVRKDFSINNFLNKRKNIKSKYIPLEQLDNEECSLCLEKLNSQDTQGYLLNLSQIYITACSHLFHKQCLRKYFRSFFTRDYDLEYIEKPFKDILCPNCRTPFGN